MIILPGVQELDSRDLLARMVLVLDFTPDRIPGQHYRPTSFLSDLYHQTDGLIHINPSQALTLAKKIAADTKAKLAPFNVTVVWGDLFSNTQLGQRWLARGRAHPNLTVDVQYVGGVINDGDYNVLGESYQAPVGTNLETFGYTFAGAYLAGSDSSLTLNRAALDLSNTAIHEWGHLIGLAHPRIDTPNNLMDAYASDTNPLASFPHHPIVTDELERRDGSMYTGLQNPAHEIRISHHQATFPTDDFLYF